MSYLDELAVRLSKIYNIEITDELDQHVVETPKGRKNLFDIDNYLNVFGIQKQLNFIEMKTSFSVKPNAEVYISISDANNANTETPSDYEYSVAA